MELQKILENGEMYALLESGELKELTLADADDFLEGLQNGAGQKILFIKKEQNEKAFLVLHKNTVEVRTDKNLSKLLFSKYESVMESRYFGKGGIEVVLSGQISEDEIYDLIRLSYNLTKESL